MIALYFALCGELRMVNRLTEGVEVWSVAVLVFWGMIGVIGAWDIRRGSSKKLAREDKLEAADERNCLIRLKAGSSAHIITQTGCGFLTAVFWGIGLAEDIEWMKGAALSATICYTLTLFSEIFAQCYYEKKN